MHLLEISVLKHIWPGFLFYCQPCYSYGQPCYQDIFNCTIHHNNPPWSVLCSSINKGCDCLSHVNQIICKLLYGMMYYGSVFHFDVNSVTFLLVTELTVTGLTNASSYISFVLITAPSNICHTILRSVLWSFSLSRVYFVWISYILFKIMVTELTYQNLNMLLEHLHFFATLQYLVLKSKLGGFCVQIHVIVKM